MDQRDQDKIIHRVVRRIADDLGCTVEEVNDVLDRHPIEIDRDKYLKRVLALQLLQLDELEEAFHDKAIVDRDVPSGVLLLKAQERRATVLGLNPMLGHSVAIVQHPPANRPSMSHRLEAALDALVEDRHKNGSGGSH